MMQRCGEPACSSGCVSEPMEKQPGEAKKEKKKREKKNATTFAHLLGRSSCRRHLELCSRLTIYRQTKRRRLRNIPHRDLVVQRDLSLLGVFAARRDTA
uniref:Uncharacterized protein n=1 Tax=Rhipicephalus zambeziensis TaxID=60191 RepID=A0A224Y7J6_9ACAR